MLQELRYPDLKKRETITTIIPDEELQRMNAARDRRLYEILMGCAIILGYIFFVVFTGYMLFTNAVLLESINAR